MVQSRQGASSAGCELLDLILLGMSLLLTVPSTWSLSSLTLVLFILFQALWSLRGPPVPSPPS